MLIHVKESIGVHCLLVHPYFSENIPNVLFVWHEWFSKWVVGDRTAAFLWDIASRFCSIQLVAFLWNWYQVFSPYALSASMWCIHIVVLTPPLTGKNWVLIYQICWHKIKLVSSPLSFSTFSYLFCKFRVFF